MRWIEMSVPIMDYHREKGTVTFIQCLELEKGQGIL